MIAGLVMEGPGRITVILPYQNRRDLDVTRHRNCRRNRCRRYISAGVYTPEMQQPCKL